MNADAGPGIVAIAAAPEDKFRRIVALLDGLRDRVVAERLIAPARPRLAHLRPARPLQPTRLLLLPVEPLLSDTPRFEPGAPSLPRRAAVLIAVAAAEAILPPTPIAPDDALRAGAAIWPRAAEWVASAAPPAGWAQAGFDGPAHAAISARLHGLLTLGTDLLAAPAAAEPLIEAERLLALASEFGEQLVICVLALLLRHPVMAPAALAASETLQAAPAVLAHTIAALCARSHDESPARLVEAARALAALRDAAPSRPGLADAVTEMARHCHASLQRAAADVRAQAETARDDAQIAALEATARDLSRLHQVASHLAGAAALAEPMASIAAAADLLPRPDAIRLLEIIAGPDAALALARSPPR